MVDKLHEYEGFVGRWHYIREGISTSWSNWKEQHPRGIKQTLRDVFDQSRPSSINIPKREDEILSDDTDYSHLYRRKTRSELVRVSAAVMGIEFSYAAETAFVSPTLLKIGVTHQHMTLVWALSPLVGFFLTPILGSLSDRCRWNFGRRRPFITILAVGVLIGLLLVPNGEDIGYSLGDLIPNTTLNNSNPTKILAHRTSATEFAENSTTDSVPNSHPWGVFFTILGTVLLDFDADACQSPSRAYLLDVTVPDDHAKGLSTFTIMAGLGGFMGYALGGINWDVTLIGVLLGGHVRAVFTLITIIFIFCVSYTITSFKEIPLPILESDQYRFMRKQSTLMTETDKLSAPVEASYGTNSEQISIEKIEMMETDIDRKPNGYSAINDNQINETNLDENNSGEDETLGRQELNETPQEDVASLKEYLQSIVIMPKSMRILCLTNLFCWMAHVCYSLYFTDFVGEAVFGGDPQATEGTTQHTLYEEGVRFGCWGMSMYSLSCACYSLIIEKLTTRFRARKVYVGGLLVYSAGMLLMALTKHKVGVILFSWSAGVMYSTLFTMPYLLIAHYHSKGTFEVDVHGQGKMGTQVRGLGTDIAIVSSMVFLAQFILSMCMGSIVTYSGTTTAVVAVASTLAFFGAISATQVMYLDL